MTWWIGLLLILYTFVCIFLVGVILLQSGKGGGLSSLGGASDQLSDALGATGAERFLSRMTTWCAIGFMVLAIIISIGGSMNAKRSTRLFNNTAAPTNPNAPLTDTDRPATQPATRPAAPPATRPAAQPAATTPERPINPPPVGAATAPAQVPGVPAAPAAPKP